MVNLSWTADGYKKMQQHKEIAVSKTATLTRSLYLRLNLYVTVLVAHVLLYLIPLMLMHLTYEDAEVTQPMPYIAVTVVLLICAVFATVLLIYLTVKARNQVKSYHMHTGVSSSVTNYTLALVLYTAFMTLIGALTTAVYVCYLIMCQSTQYGNYICTNHHPVMAGDIELTLVILTVLFATVILVLEYIAHKKEKQDNAHSTDEENLPLPTNMSETTGDETTSMLSYSSRR